MKKSQSYIPYSKKKYSPFLLFSLFLSLLFSLQCLKKEPRHYDFWKGYSSLQKSIKSSTTNEAYLQALNGIASNSITKDLESNQDGNPYITLAGKFQNKSNWNLNWYGKKSSTNDFYSQVEFIPKSWDEKEIYSVERTVTHSVAGFTPSDFFNWLADFASLLNDHIAFDTLRSESENLKFLCSTLQCQVTETAGWQMIQFTLNETTKAKFPGFYNRSGSRLEKTKLSILIWDRLNPSHKIRLANQGKTLQFYFPVNPPKDFFRNPKEIRFLGDLEIKSYGITLKLQSLEYRLKVNLKKNDETLQGQFVRLGKKEISGNFLYFIPTGIVDFFIPGNLDEYLSNAMTLMVTGTQGRGGSQLRANFKTNGNSQTTTFNTYSEIMRKRFSLFGNDDSQKVSQDFEFYSAWEDAMMKDLQ